MAKIAPVLKKIAGQVHWLEDMEAWDKAREELKALCAVVKAADEIELRRAVWVVCGTADKRKDWLASIRKWQKAREKLRIASGGKPW
jgi:hypothetical protein